MSEIGLSRVRLRIAARGYDRDEVDARLVDNDRAAERFQARLRDIEAEVAETDQRAQALEAKVSELEGRGTNGPPESVQWLHDVTDQIIRVTSDDAAELMIKMENEAKAEKQDAERAAADIMAEAQGRAVQITEAARRDQDDAAKMRMESNEQIGLYVDQGKAAAEERADAMVNDRHGGIHDVRRERERLADQNRLLLEELNHVRGTVQDLEKYLGHERPSED